MDHNKLPLLRMEEPSIVDRNALSGRVVWDRPAIRRLLPPALRRRPHAATPRRTAPAPPPARRSRMVHGQPDPPRTWVNALGWQISACLLICLLVLGMKMMDTPMVDAVLDGLAYTVNTPTDFEDLGKLKFVSALIDKTAEVFNIDRVEPEFAWPARGPVAAGFEGVESNHAGLTITVKDGSAVTAAMDGQVFYVGENRRWGSYVRMRHSGGWDTILSGIKPAVKTGQDVLRGELLGWCAGTKLYFEIWNDGVPVDPEPLLPDIAEEP
ncbi:MAG: murein hydrolase activator EnvC family protein [Christensenellales bacterium]|jgi:hypothetical protein